MVLCLASQQRFAVAIGSSAMRPITPSRMAAAMLASAMMLAASTSASADEIRVTSSNALKPVLEQVAPEFENATGHKLVFTWGQAEILKGTSFDLVVLTAAVVDKLIMQGRLIGGTRTAVAVSAAGLAVRKDAAKSYISTVESFKRTLLNARSITFGEQGGTGAYLMALFGRLGIADAQQLARDPVPAAKAGASP
jgi:molybdate transport system substrate-binding protein